VIREITKIKVIFGVNSLRDINVELKEFKESPFEVVPGKKYQ